MPGRVCLLALTACGAQGPSGGGDGAARTHVAFVTSDLMAAAFGSDADTTCTALAARAGLPGTFVAWVVAMHDSPVERLRFAGPWVRTDGRPVANSVDDLVAGNLQTPIDRDEGGNLPGGDPNLHLGYNAAWTGVGSFVDSMPQDVHDCNDWSPSVDGGDAWVGDIDVAGPNFQHQGLVQCNIMFYRPQAHLYCFEAD